MVMISALPKDAVPMYAMGVDQPKYIGSENVVSTLLALPPVRRRWRSGARVLSSVVRLMTTTHTTTTTQLKGGLTWRGGRCASQDTSPGSVIFRQLWSCTMRQRQ